MTTGNAVIATVSVGAGSYADIRPASSNTEWVVHNVMGATGATLQLVAINSSTSGVVDVAVGGWRWLALHVTYGEYLRVYNLSASTIVLRYDGVVSWSV